MDRRLEKGEKIVCPECGELICIVNREIPEGSILMPEFFEMIQIGHGAGKGMNCLDCGTAFARRMIHTEKGWK